MKLNLDIIRDSLETPQDAKFYGVVPKSRTLERPLLYTPGDTWEPGKLYVAQGATLPRVPAEHNFTLICTAEEMPKSWLYSGVSLLTVRNAPSAAALFRAVQGIFDRFDRWELALMEELSKNSDFDIHQVIRLGVAVLENPVYMMDSAMQILFSTDLTGEGDIRVSDHSEYLNLQHMESIKQACPQERSIRVPYLSAVENDGRWYCYNLYPMDHFAGCVCFGEIWRKFRDSDFALADFFFPLFQRAYEKRLRTLLDTESPKVAALSKLLEHQTITPQERALLGLGSGERWRFFSLRERDLRRSMPKDYMYATLCALLPGTVIPVLHKGDIVGLVKWEQGEAEAFRDLLRRMDYFCGLSNPFTDLRELDTCFRQASFAVGRFPEQGREEMLPFQDCLLAYFLQHSPGQMPLDALEAEGLTALREYDRRKGSDYWKTLDTYLNMEMSVSRTSQALYIHRSSLLKRLEKIHRLTGFDLEDPDTRLYLRLYLRLRQE